MQKTFLSKSEKDTLRFARKFAKSLRGGEVVCLSGDLGRGKTVFARGLAEGLGTEGIITSPTFVIMKLYRAENRRKIKNVCHVDAYRIGGPHELEDIGLPEYFGRRDVVCIIEWAEKIREILPKDRIEIKFELGNSEEERKITVSR